MSLGLQPTINISLICQCEGHAFKWLVLSDWRFKRNTVYWIYNVIKQRANPHIWDAGACLTGFCCWSIDEYQHSLWYCIAVEENKSCLCLCHDERVWLMQNTCTVIQRMCVCVCACSVLINPCWATKRGWSCGCDAVVAWWSDVNVNQQPSCQSNKVWALEW